MRALFTGVTWRSVALVVVDHLLLVGSVLAAYVLRLGLDQLVEAPSLWALIWRVELIALVVQLLLHYCDLYDPRVAYNRRDVLIGLVQALGASSLILAVIYYWVPTVSLGRGVVFLSAVFIALSIVVWRTLFEWVSIGLGPAERLLIVGTSAAAVDLAREIYDRRHSLGVEFVGFIDADEAKVGMPVLNPGVIGTISDIPDIVRDRRVDRVVVSLADARGKFSMDKLLAMKLNQGVNFDHLASVYERYTGKIAIENLRPSWLIFSEGFQKTWTLQATKRALDLLAATVLLLVASPVMFLAALATRLSSPGPILYRQTRVGLHGRPFSVVKFRSMYQDAEARTGAVWAVANDPRVTPVGRFMRRTRLDELPQLWNVIRGEMSFVGPRPERPEFVARLSEQIPFYGQRHAVRPGLTGWAQVRHEYTSTIEESMQKLQFDLYYIKHLSLALDVFIILETIKTVLVRRGS
jgi:sugar transferase (PEP-CTERM system associated)